MLTSVVKRHPYSAQHLAEVLTTVHAQHTAMWAEAYQGSGGREAAFRRISLTMLPACTQHNHDMPIYHPWQFSKLGLVLGTLPSFMVMFTAHMQ